MRAIAIAMLLSGCHPAGQAVDGGGDLAMSAPNDLGTAPADMVSAPGDLGGTPDPNGNKGTIVVSSGTYTLGANTVTSATAGASFASVSGATTPTCSAPLTFGPCLVIGGCTGTVMIGTSTAASAGQVTITGGTPTVMIAPNASNQYAGFSQSSPLWTTATTLTVSAAGATVPAFSTMLTAPAQPDFTTPTFPASTSLTIDRSTDFHVAWTGGNGGTVTLQLQTNTAQAEFVRCIYDSSSNSATIPTAALQQVQAGATGNLAMSVTSTAQLVQGGWTIAITVGTPATQGGRLLASGVSVTFQ